MVIKSKNIGLTLTTDEIALRNNLSVEEVKNKIEDIRNTLTPLTKEITVVENGVSKKFMVSRLGVGPIITSTNRFYLFEFSIDDKWQKYEILFNGNLGTNKMPITNGKHLFLRVDSACETGQKFGDKTCECKEQLDKATALIEKEGGMIIHIPSHDGRGKGLAFKLATMALQEELKLNTVEAALALTDEIDVRTYTGIVAILKFFDVPKDLYILTNNSDKLKVFYDNNYNVNMVDLVIPPTEHTKHHLSAKQEYLGHKGLIRGDK